MVVLPLVPVMAMIRGSASRRQAAGLRRKSISPITGCRAAGGNQGLGDRGRG